MEEVKDLFEDVGRKHMSFSLAQAKASYESRRGSDGAMRPTEASSFDLTPWSAPAQPRVETQAEEAHRLFQKAGRKHLSSALLEARGEYASRADRSGGTDGNGRATEAKAFTFEHTSASIARRAARRREEAVRKFRQIDADGSGALDAGDVAAGSPSLGLTEATALAWHAELKGPDGEVALEAFLDRYMEAQGGGEGGFLLEKSEHGLDARGFTQAERSHADMVDPGKQQ